MTRVFGFFAKHPAPGLVKTRLGKTIGPAESARLYQAFLKDIANRFRARFDRGIIGWSMGSGEFTTAEMNTARAAFSELARDDYELWEQPAGPLGIRMQAFFEEAFTAGASSAVLIGSDSPTLPLEYVDRAFEELAHRPLVLGPATDGGYYLIGQSGAGRAVFRDIDWSTSRVLQQTIQRARQLQLSPALLDPWYDVDTLDDLIMLAGHLTAQVAAGHEIPAETWKILQRPRFFPDDA